jgi:hypothetical protein
VPCDYIPAELPEATRRERTDNIRRALLGLTNDLQAGRVKVVIGTNGAVAFDGRSEKDRRGVSDVCAYRTLMAQGSWALRQAVVRAEQMSGRKVNQKAVAMGTHSHDGGQTWSPGEGN